MGFLTSYIVSYISSRFFENQPNEICSHLSEKASKGRFFKRDKLQNHSKRKEKRKSEEKETRRREKAMAALPTFYNSYFGDSLWPKKTVGSKRSIWR